MIIAVSASREGLTPYQAERVTHALRRPQVTGIVHGDCVGGDEDVHAIARKLGLDCFAYPSNLPRFRAHTDATLLAEPAEPLTRNVWIVEYGRALVACPSASSRGTWHAVSCARSRGKALVVYGPESVLERRVARVRA